MVERKEVEALLAIAESQPLDEPVPTATLAALCRAWLAVEDAPVMQIGGADGLRVRIVKEGE